MPSDVRDVVAALERRARTLRGASSTTPDLWRELLYGVYECARAVRERGTSIDRSTTLANAQILETALSQLVVVIEEELAKSSASSLDRA